MMALRLTSHGRQAGTAWLLSALLLIAACVLAGEARAQDLILPPQPAPPPMRYVPELERAQLASAGDAGDRVRATLNLLEERLAHAERNTAAAHFDPAAADLGIYQGLLEDVLLFLRPVGRSADGRRVDAHTRDLYKRLEQTINRHTARIELIRRQTPQEYQANIRDAFNYARDRRTECLDAFFGASVLHEPPAESSHDPAKDSTRKPPAQIPEDHR
ncbi:MAG: hypothetical protein ACJ741_06895 [Pyrinomonadaceae bacterium]